MPLFLSFSVLQFSKVKRKEGDNYFWEWGRHIWEQAVAGNGTHSSSQPLMPIFKGDKYHFWSLKMKPMFKSWDLVENGYIGRDQFNATNVTNSCGKLSQERCQSLISHPMRVGWWNFFENFSSYNLQSGMEDSEARVFGGQEGNYCKAVDTLSWIWNFGPERENLCKNFALECLGLLVMWIWWKCQQWNRC